jgi:hypothetical protein
MEAGRGEGMSYLHNYGWKNRMKLYLGRKNLRYNEIILLKRILENNSGSTPLCSED